MSPSTIAALSRVGGDLEIRLDVDAGHVRHAWVQAPMFRGFERILVGRAAHDALVYAPRACGACSVSHSVAAAAALAQVTGARAPRNGELAANLMLACENAASHFANFYLSFMPDFASGIYAGEPWHTAAHARFDAQAGSAAREALAPRAQLLNMMGVLAGKWPHTLAVQPGGTTRAVPRGDVRRLLALIGGFRDFLERRLFGDSLESILALDSVAALEGWRDARAHHASDFTFFLHLADALALHELGAGPATFMSCGAFPLEGTKRFSAGVWHGGTVRPLNLADVAEDASHSWLAGETALAPQLGHTCPVPDKAEAYTWCKAPRLAGEAVEVGALARQLIAGQPLIADLVARRGANVPTRVIARLVELAQLIEAMEEWAHALVPDAPYFADLPAIGEAEGVGLTEAAGGSLGHWLRVRGATVEHYQIVAPSTWNFSPRDRSGTPGAVEQALAGAPVRPGERVPVAVQHVVSSYDPCMVCAVH